MTEAPEDPVRVQEETRGPIPKIKRTYGRKRDVVDASDDPAANALLSNRTRLEPQDKIKVTDYNILGNTVSNDASDTFGWRERLADIDRQFDEEGQEENKFRHEASGNRTSNTDGSAPSTSTEDGSSSLNDETRSSIPPPISSQSDPPSPCPSGLEVPTAKTLSIDVDTVKSIEVTQDEPFKPPTPRSHLIDVFEIATRETSSSSEDEHSLIPAARLSIYGTQSDNGIKLDLGEVVEHPDNGKIQKGKEKDSTHRVKKLSKKEERESKKAHARIMAEQIVSISKRAEQYTIEDLLKSVQQGQLLSEVKPCAVSSDPIQEFTSSPMFTNTNAATSVEPEEETLQKKKEDVEAERKMSLALAKRRALESLRIRAATTDSEDDDLEVISAIPKTNKKISRRTKVSVALEKKLANVAGFRVGSSKDILSDAVENTQSDRAIKLAAKPNFRGRDDHRTKGAVDHRHLQVAMLSKAAKQSMQLTKEKEEEWRRRGGKLTGKQRAAFTSEPLSLGRLVGDLAINKQSIEDAEDMAETGVLGSDSQDDGGDDWQPNEGSVCDLQENNIDYMEEPTEDEDENAVQPTRQARRLTNRPVLLDSDDEKAGSPRVEGRILVPDTSLIMNDDGQGTALSPEGIDEEDKENDISLAIDSGDDKENVMVVQRAPVTRPTLGSRQSGGIFSLEDRAQRLSISPTADAEGEEVVVIVRKPLQARKMGELDDPFVLRSPASSLSPGTPRSKRTLSVSASPVSLQPAFGGRLGALTQLFNDEEGIPMDAPAAGPLQPAFHLQTRSDRKAPPTRTPVAIRVAETEDTPEIRERFLPKKDELSLTLDTKFQPHLNVTTQVRRQADLLFEKEQDCVLEEASTSATSTSSKQELYITENGLLTQTKPEGSTPLVYRGWAPPQKSGARQSGASEAPLTTKRLPLSTLSLLDDTVSPSQQRRGRLIKGKDREGAIAEDGLRAFSPTGHPSNAFARLLEGARRQQRRNRRKLGKSDFVEGEAIESDEDELFGFGRPAMQDDDEESDGDDPEAVVENLVDDKTMDAEELGEDKVLEKVKEQLEEEDAALQKYHQAAVEGKYRGKRRGGGIALDDSESDEDDEDEARRLRRRMHKKRRIQGDKLEDLKKDKKSRAFYNAYQRDIQDEEDDDFMHLANDDLVIEDENDENEQPESVSASEIREQLRQAARQEKNGEKPFDIKDAEWVHPSTSDDDFEVKEIDDRPKRVAPRRPVSGQVDVVDLDDSLSIKPGELTEQQAAQLDAWRKEQSGRNIGTGGMRGAITVTGHGTKMPTRNIRSTARRAVSRQEANEHPVHRKKITKTASVLASVSDKHSRFSLS